MNDSFAGGVRTWWEQHRATVLIAVTVGLGVVAALRLETEFHRLLWSNDRFGAVDLKRLHGWVTDWFAGVPIYGKETGAYPPASYMILWPLMGWLSLPAARWCWALTSAVAVGWLCYLLVRESGAGLRVERALVTVLVLASTGVGITIGNGQVILHLLPCLLAGLFFLARQRGTWLGDLWSSTLLVVALIKPSVTLPFFWIVLFVPDRWRPAGLAGLGYLALTFWAAAFQADDWETLFQKCLTGSSAAIVRHAGYGNVHRLLTAWSLDNWLMPASLLMLAGLGVWTYLHRRVDLWLLIGVAAIIARMWTYHRPYDDVLIVLPAISLFRLAKQEAQTEATRLVAAGLFVVTALTLITPDRLLYSAHPLSGLFATGHTLTWLLGLIFLVGCAKQERRRKIQS